MNSESYFDGGILGYIGYSILGAIICAFTLGIGTPWAVLYDTKLENETHCD